MHSIQEIKTKSEIKQFVKFPWLIYKRDQNWVPPLISEQVKFFEPGKNPYFQHSKVLLLMAYRNGLPVGRLAVHENIPHIKKYGEKMGFFGFFECVDDFEVAKSLFNYGIKWLRGLGYFKVRGPANFTINGEYSLLVDGFDSAPMIMMTYNPAYYPGLIERYGFKKSQDMYAYQMFSKQGLPQHVLNKAREVEKTFKNFTVRKMRKKDLEKEALIVLKIYNDAWNENWGAVPFSEQEMIVLAKELKMILDEDIAYVGELDGKPVGFSLSIPDANQALKAANGHLFPFGLLKMLWKKRSISAIRVLVMGVLKEYRHHGFDSVFYKKTYEEGVKKGYTFAEASLINESNAPMRKVLEKVGAKIYKTYRMYDLDI